ncbi:hypothetical protein LguiB_018300 [Lonicera macranthoides]
MAVAANTPTGSPLNTQLSFSSLRRCSHSLFALARLSPIATGPPPPITVTMPPIRTSAIPNSRQQIKDRLSALQNPLPIASSSSSQQDSPALPLVVTACSTTDSNATTTAAPVRSIRSQQQAQPSGTQSGATTGDDGKKKNKRCVVTGKKTASIVRSLGRSVLIYDPEVRGIPNQDLEGRVVLDIGSCVRDRIPMTCLNYSNMPVESRMIVFDYLSARVRAATNETVSKMMADRPATEEGSECSIQLSLDEEIRIIESEIGSSRGIRIRGFGNSVVKEPKKRDPVESVQINLQMAARIEQQDARIAELETMEARQKAEIEAMEARQKAEIEAMEARVRDLVSSMMANLSTGGGRPREV